MLATIAPVATAGSALIFCQTSFMIPSLELPLLR
jgi:hypothetical protein